MADYKKKSEATKQNPLIIDKILQSSFLNPGILGDDVQPVGSDQVGFYMDSGLFFISTDYSPVMLKIYFERQHARVALVHHDGSVLGIITRDRFEREDKTSFHQPISEFTIPWNQVPTAGYLDSIEDALTLFSEDIHCLIVLNNGTPMGALFRDDLTWCETGEKRGDPAKIEGAGLKEILDHLPEGFVVTDDQHDILYFNRHAADLLPNHRHGIGRKFEIVFGDMFAKNHQEFMAADFLNKAAVSMSPVHNVECTSVAGLTFLANFMPIVKQDHIPWMVISFRDITCLRWRQKEEQVFFDDLTHAFKLLLPDVRMERSLKNIPEYKDNFNPDTGMIQITGVIPEGGFKHVINCLKIASELSEKGVFEIPEIDKGVVIQALIAHDIGKNQPRLLVGDVVNPKACFADGKIHARDSARIVSNLPMIFSQDVVTLIMYHHHEETELPENFPTRLLPNLRLVKLIDGLSAGLTRKDARLSLNVEKCKVTVFETNPNPRYNGIIEVDLVAGGRTFNRLKI